MEFKHKELLNGDHFNNLYLYMSLDIRLFDVIRARLQTSRFKFVKLVPEVIKRSRNQVRGFLVADLLDSKSCYNTKYPCIVPKTFIHGLGMLKYLTEIVNFQSLDRCTFRQSVTQAYTQKENTSSPKTRSRTYNPPIIFNSHSYVISLSYAFTGKTI